MKRFFVRWMLIAIALFLTSPAFAQTIAFSDGFESGDLSNGWTQSSVSTNPPLWSVGGTGISGVTAAHQGTAYAWVASSTPSAHALLQSGLIDISMFDDAELSFALIMPEYSGGVHDTLRVYMRSTSTANWSLVSVCDAAMASWNQLSIPLTNYLGGNVQIGFEFTCGGGRGVGLDNVEVKLVSNCFQPNALKAFRVTHNSAELNWAAHSSALSYNLKVSSTPLTDMLQTGDVFDGFIYVKPHVLSSLNASTTYYFYVQADCDVNGQSSWSEAGVFTTACTPSAIPFAEDFNSYQASISYFPACWSRVMNSFGDWGSVDLSMYRASTVSNGFNQSTAISIPGYYEASDYYTETRRTQNYVSSPAMAVTDMATLQVAFYMNAASADYKLNVGVMEDPNDETTFQLIATVQTHTPGFWEHFVLPLNTYDGTGKYLTFMVDGNDGTNKPQVVLVDQVQIDVIAACQPVSVIWSDSITSSSANIVWTGTDASYSVKVSSIAINPEITQGDVFDGVVSVTQLRLNNLVQHKNYYYYVKNDCDVNGEWSVEHVFQTECASLITALPFEENFDDYGTKTIGMDSSFPTCWSRIQDTSFTDNSPYITAGGMKTGVGTLQFYTQPNKYAVAVMPEMDVNNMHEISMRIDAGTPSSGNRLSVGVMTDPDDLATFVEVTQIIPTQNSMLQTYEVYFDQYAGAGKYIALRGGTSDYNNFYVDNVVIDVAPNCLPTYDLRVEQITQSSAQLLWSASGSAVSYMVKVSTSPLNNPEVDAADVFQANQTTCGVSLTSLSASANYYVYVKRSCTDGQSEWVSVIFRTDCGIITSLPYKEAFDDMRLNAMPSCWKNVYTQGSNPYVAKSNYDYGFNGSAALRITASNSLVAMPAVSTPIEDLYLSMMVTQQNASSGMLIVGVVTDTLDQSSFTAVDTIELTNYLVPTLVEVSFAASAVTGANHHVAFRQVSQSSYNTFWIDEVTLENQPTCTRVNDISLNSLTENSAAVSWQPAQGEGSWRIAIGEKPYTPGNPHGTIYTATQSNYDFTGLEPETAYECYVQAICGAADSAAWSRHALQFITTDAPAQTPYHCGFENAQENSNWKFLNGELSNQWYIANAVAANGSNALYISNDGGISNLYSYKLNGDRSNVYAYRTLALESGQYNIAFDWKLLGRNSEDLLCAFLVPATAEMMVAGNGDLTTHYPYTSSYFNTTSMKPGWNLLGGNALLMQTSWQSFSQVVTITEPGNYRLVFYWANKSNPWGSDANPPAAVDNVSVTEILCASPGAIDAVLTDTSANLTWVSFNGANRWEVKVSTSTMTQTALNNNQANVFNGYTTQESLMVNGLQGNTTYYCYLRSFCTAADTSLWAMYEFKTPCGTLNDFPISFNFDGLIHNSVPDCWTVVTAYNGLPSIYNYNNQTPGGTGCLYFGAPQGNYSTIAMQSLGDVDAASLLITFYAYYYNSGPEIQVGVMTDPSDATTFQLVDSHILRTARTWEPVEISLSQYTGTGKYIALRLVGTSGDAYIQIDDVTVIRENPCKTPHNIVVSRLEQNTAKINWMSPNTGSLSNVAVSDHPMIPDTCVNGYLYPMMQDNYLDLTDLVAGQTYYVYVQSICGDNSYSDWSGATVFTTPCQAVSVPYVQDFSQGNLGEQMPCMMYLSDITGTIASTANPLKPVVNNIHHDGNDSKSYRLYAHYEAISLPSGISYAYLRNIAILPQTEASIGALQLKLNHYTDLFGSKLYIGTMYDPSDINTLEVYDSIMMSSWKESIISFQNYTGTDRYIAIWTDGELNQRSYNGYIDGIVLDSLQECQAPILARSSGVTDRTARLDWGSVTGRDTLWQVQVTHVNVGTNVAMVDTITSFVLDTLVSSPSVQLTGLNPNTTYYYYIRSVCAEGQYSDRFKQSMSFTTTCLPQALPLFEGFDNTEAFQGCWQVLMQTETATPLTTWAFNNMNGYLYEGEGTAVLTMQRESYSSYLVSPKITVPAANQYQVSFAMLRSSYQMAQEGVKVWVNTTPDTIGATQLCYIHRSFELTPVESAMAWYEYEHVIPMSGELYVIFEGINRSGSSIYLDNITIESTTACERIKNIAASQIRATTVDIDFDNATASNVEYVVGAVGFDPASGTIVTAGNGNSVTINGLQSNTHYHAYVRTNCGAGNVSPWMRCVFLTKQVPATLPYSTDFEDATENAAWSMVGEMNNQFYIGSATAQAGSNALYISNDLGQNNNYDMTALSYAFAYRTVTLNAGSYHVEYDWKAMGENYGDYGLMYIVPGDVILTPNQNNGINGTYSIPSGWISMEQVMQGQSQWQHKVKDVNINKSGDYHLLFYWVTNSASGVNPALAIDNLSIELNRCHTPFNITATNLTGSSADISAITDAEQMQVKVDTRYFPTSQVGNEVTLVDTMLNQSQVTIAGLLPQTSYYYWIRTICNGDTSAWMGGSSFTTGCAVISISETDPYVENFETYSYNYSAIRPDCWYANSYSASYTPTVYNYGAYSGNNCFMFRTGGAGSVTYTVLPEFDSEVKHLTINFMGKTGYGAKSGLSVGVMTDKTDFSTFELIATTANSSTWDSCQVSFANYTGTGKYIVLAIQADIYGTYSDYTIDDLNVEYSRVNQQVQYNYQDQVCEGYGYTGYGFDIDRTQLTDLTAPYTFQRVGIQTQGADSLVILTLTVVPNIVNNIMGEICDGDTYIANGFTESTEGVFRQTFTAANLCDSVVYLHLTVNPTYDVDDRVSIRHDELPYAYLDTVFGLNTVEGTVLYVLNRQTAEGCDSTVNLYLTLEAKTGLGYVEDTHFSIYPNPIQRGGEVTLNAHVDMAAHEEVVVEVYATGGQRIMTLRPDQFPLVIDGFEQSGVYMIRIVADHTVLYTGKVIVQ